MSAISYIHSYDLTWQLGGLLGGGAAGCAVYLGTEACCGGSPFPTILGWASGLGITLLLSMLPVPTYLYIRHDLQTPISLADARKLEFIFLCPFDPKRWRPHREVLQLPREQRREYLFRQIQPKARS